jgi:putative hydrolase of the HAD superfamily
METSWFASIKDSLQNLDPIGPISTGVQPVLGNLTVKALIFDIYGTLLISASGDIDKETFQARNLEQALKHSGFKVAGKKKEETLDLILVEFTEAVRKQHLRAKEIKMVSWPEIDAVETWQSVIEISIAKGLISGENHTNIRSLAYLFELFSNPVFPMPGMQDTIRHFDENGFTLGIVSNAQAYTPLFMNFFLYGRLENGREIPPFRDDLTIYSYELKRAKPDVTLFYNLSQVLYDRYNIEPSEAVYIGNDMLNDIFTANKAGFKTILFAGDKRSLRWREGHELVEGISPDLIITNLEQLKDIIHKG